MMCFILTKHYTAIPITIALLSSTPAHPSHLPKPSFPFTSNTRPELLTLSLHISIPPILLNKQGNLSLCSKLILHRVVVLPVSVTHTERPSGRRTTGSRWLMPTSPMQCYILVGRMCFIMYVVPVHLFLSSLTLLKAIHFASHEPVLIQSVDCWRRILFNNYSSRSPWNDQYLSHHRSQRQHWQRLHSRLCYLRERCNQQGSIIQLCERSIRK